MIYLIKYLYFAFSLELEIVLDSLKHPNYKEEIIKGNMPLYEIFKGKKEITSEPWKDYCGGRSIIQMAWMAYIYNKGKKHD